MDRLMQFLQREISGLHEAAYLLAFTTFVTQLLALVRDKLLAYSFGASHILDLYYAAFRIPDMVYATVASAVAASVLVPFLVKKSGEGKEKTNYFIDHVFSAFFCVVVIVSIALFFAMPYLIPKLLPGFVGDTDLPKLITASRILLFSPIFLGISNFLASITQMYNRFLIYAASPLMYNIGIISGILFFYPIFGLYGLVGGVILGTVLHMLLQVPFVASQKLLPSLRLPFDWAEVKEVVLVSLPRTLTLSSNQISMFFLVAFATLMGEGAVSIFNFSFNLQSVPLALIGVSYSSAVFPTLAKLYESKNIAGYVEQMIASAKHILFWSMPTIALFVVLRAQIVRAVLGAGNFDWSDTRLTAALLSILVISATAQCLILLFVRAYYAEGKTMKPLFVNIFGMLLVVASAYIARYLFLTFPSFAFFTESILKVANLEGSIVLVLGIAYSSGMIVNAYLLWRMFGKEHSGFTRPVLQTFFHSGSAAIIGGYAAHLSLYIFAQVFDLHTILGIFLQGLCSGLVGLFIWILVLFSMRNTEIKEVWTALHGKIFKAKVVGVDPEVL